MYDGPLEDRIAIRERIEAYSDAVFRHDADDWIANWSEGAVWSLPGFEVSGRDQIKAAWIQAMSGFRLAAFFASPGAIVVRGDRAEVRVYTQEILSLADGGLRRIVGAYDDELAKVDGAWLFRKRIYRILHDETGA